MSKQNRKKVYDRLVKEGRLSRDDGALIKEFGLPSDDYKDIDPSFKLPKREEIIQKPEPKRRK